MQTVIKAPNVQLNGPDSVEAVLKELTLEEKLYLLTGGSGFGTCAVERLGIPAAMMVDSAAGIIWRSTLATCIRVYRFARASLSNRWQA